VRVPGRSANTIVIALAFVAFVSLGLPDGLLGVAWPGIRRTFDIPLDAMGVILAASTAGYMISSFVSGALMRTMGVGLLLAASCAATGTALAMYSFAPSWPIFVGFGLLAGLGAGAIDAGLNNYVDRYHGERLMQWLHASFGVGITLGPAIMTAGLSLTGRWEPGYRVVAAAQIALALVFLGTRRRWQGGPAPAEGEPCAGTGGPPAAARSTPPGASEPPAVARDAPAAVASSTTPGPEAALRETIVNLPSLVSMLLFFVYTGCEVGLGLWVYSLLTEARGVAPEVAGIIAGSYWGMFTVGRIVAGVYSARVPVRSLVTGSILFTLGGAAIVAANARPVLTIVGVCVAGLAIAPVFPAMLSDTRNRVAPRHLSNTIGMQISAAGLGVAAGPGLAGVAARAYGLEAIPVYIVGSLMALLVLFLAAHRRRPSMRGRG